MAAQRYAWANDKSRFGMKLMEKMGWKEGKGLGKEEDGCVESVKPQRMGSEMGVGAPSKSEANWLAPGVLASGFNDVLARLAPVGVDVPSTQTAPKDIKQVKTNISRRVRQPRGFYERRRARKNIGTYSPTQLAEIFGGVHTIANVGSAVAELTCTTEIEGKSRTERKVEETVSVIAKAELGQIRDDPITPKTENEKTLGTIKSVIKDENVVQHGNLAMVSVREDCQVKETKPKKREKKKKTTSDLPISSKRLITKPSKAQKFKLKCLSK